MAGAKPIRWVGSARADLRTFPQSARRDVGQALYAAQRGEIHPSVKPLKGFGGASVLEIVAAASGSAYRTVYTVRFDDVIYVLHAFQKKSKQGVKTPKKHVELIRERLKAAVMDHAERSKQRHG